jgi:hypothetical protein
MYLPGEQFGIGTRVYTIASLPGAPAFSDAREGRAAVVYRVECGGTNQALKVFKSGFSRASTSVVDQVMGRLALIPGLVVATHVSVEGPSHRELLLIHPDLEHAHLMPWVDGPTWQACIVEKRALSVSQAIAIAKSLASTFGQLESIGVAHCDLSGGNIVLPLLLPGYDYGWPAEIVDLDQVYCSDLDAPVQPTLGSPGYQLPGADRHWGLLADRYAGGTLLAEVLSWPDAEVRSVSGAESYNDPASQENGVRRREVQAAALRRLYGSTALSDLLACLFASRVLTDCPALIDWHREIAALSATPALQAKASTTNQRLRSPHDGSDVRIRDGDLSPSPSGATSQMPTWEFDVGGSRQMRMAYGVLAFGLVALVAAAVAAAGFSWGEAFMDAVISAGGRRLAQAISGAVAGLLVGVAEAWLLRRAFSAFGGGAYVALSVAGGLAGGFVGGWSVDALSLNWYIAGALAGAVAGLVASASQMRRLTHGNPAIWISYHCVGWALIWGLAWELSFDAPGALVGQVLAVATFIFASGILTVLALEKMPQFEF